jgi:hypothetical protein
LGIIFGDFHISGLNCQYFIAYYFASNFSSLKMSLFFAKKEEINVGVYGRRKIPTLDEDFLLKL